MDVERTMEFILKSQARAEVRMEKAEIRMDKAEVRMDKLDKRMDGIAKLIQQGMRTLVKVDRSLAELVQAQKRTDVHISELSQAQKATEKSLKAFIDSLKHGRNGRNGR
jgi:hypothetical protein